MKTTLVAVSGMSPAILTETIWALAEENPPIVPDEVVVITTSRGERDLREQLLSKRDGAWGGKTVWEQFRADVFALAKSPDGDNARLQLSLRVVELPDAESGVRRKADDLRSGSDHDETADFIVGTLAPFCDAEDNHVIASIAGGRKTMGALLYAAMSLIGKESDRVTHVLVSEPYEMARGFFYPAQPDQNLEARTSLHSLEAVAAADAEIELADIPFVPLRNKFAELNEPRRTFSGLVERYSRTERNTLSEPPQVFLDIAEGTFSVEGRPLALTGRDLVVTAFLYDRATKLLPHFRDRSEATPELQTFVKLWKRSYPTHRATSRLSREWTEEDLTKALANLRSKLKKLGLAGAVAHLAPERGRIGFEIARKARTSP
jgi:CRISPR-associated protein (TIGR02584 family)